MARLAFCGLGRMGGPMAARLLEAGHDLAVWNRTPARADALVERGARRASSPADAAVGAQAVFTMLATPDPSGRWCPANFSLAMAAKDVRLVVEAAGRLGVELPLADAARAHLDAAEAAGLGGLDYSAVVAHIRGREAADAR